MLNTFDALSIMCLICQKIQCYIAHHLLLVENEMHACKINAFIFICLDQPLVLNSNFPVQLFYSLIIGIIGDLQWLYF